MVAVGLVVVRVYSCWPALGSRGREFEWTLSGAGHLTALLIMFKYDARERVEEARGNC